jgi:hypothetical protein
MSFNLSAAPIKEDIKVGYIDPVLGYVDGVTICEANQYAKDNPGTTFIFKNGDNNLQYLNINEVNQLTPKDLFSTKSDECGGIQQYKECGPPRVQFFGGGGVGAVGNPVVGLDGSLLAVDLVSGGNGYQYPPLVAARDDCQFGNGAVLKSVLGETPDQTEVYEGEEDFEEYELCDNAEVSFGLKYGADGEPIGEWDPDAYTQEPNADPIQREIEIFQKVLERPFWTTRKKQPDRINAENKQYERSYKVTHPEWNEFMNEYAVSPVKPSETTGTDEAGKVFTIEWEHNFPITGEYIFRGLCDNKAEVFIDDAKVGDLKPFNQDPKPFQSTIQEGNHIIKVELFNTPDEVNSGSGSLPAKFIIQNSVAYLQVDGTGTGQVSFSMNVDDNPNIAGLAAKEVVIPSDSGNISLRRDISKEKDSDSGSGTFTGGKTYGPIQIIGAASGAQSPIISKSGANTLALRDSDGDDENITITVSSVSSVTSSTEKVISPKSWQENPMGVSMIIEPPEPTVPQEQPPEQTGKCPPNPIWSTRFPGSSEKWYPVRYTRYEFRQGPNDTNPGVLGATAINNALSDGLTTEQIRAEAEKQGLKFNENASSILSATPSASTSSNSSGGVWSDFMNRYALSPVLPLDTPGSDSSGVTFTNSWDIDLPYAGFYGVKGAIDNTGRVLIDGVEISKLDNPSSDNPEITKVPLTKGKHTITIEVSNNPVETQSKITNKIFNTKDWRVASPSSSSSLTAKFIIQNSNAYLQVDGTGSGEISLSMDVDDNPNIAGLAAKEIIIPADNGSISLKRDELKQKDNSNGTGTFTAGKKYGPIQIIGAGPAARGPIVSSSNRLGIRDADGDDENIKITIGSITSSSPSTQTSQSPTKNGVTYEGPTIFGWTDSRWSKFMNNASVSPKVFGSTGDPDERVVGKYTLAWKNVNFPETGIYKFAFQADNVASFSVGGKKIYETTDFIGDKVQYTFNITQGKYDIVIELENKKTDKGGDDDFTFSKNPMGVALSITRDTLVGDSGKTSWKVNPMAISAILIPPPCAKKIGGKGVVEKVIVEDPGNGYLPPQGNGYPATLVLDQVIVENPGINYSCGQDQIRIVPSNGAELSYNCDSFGRINSVNVLNPGVGFNIYPEISLPSETGVNASFRPVFRVVRDPLLPPDKLIQVVDLVGLKQTGYVDGRAYYGAVYYDQGIPYAGYYKTAGTQVRVYATLQESITAQVTTPASAIQRSGTDITSNDPRLNIPGTPESTT